MDDLETVTQSFVLGASFADSKPGTKAQCWASNATLTVQDNATLYIISEIAVAAKAGFKSIASIVSLAKADV